ncbi:uncharacterized protein MYU51_016945 [Penicillium brevicompactum]|uniref:uncharacterized protein n=1 Tax=Penicillium brevicompactum TaxID=5074 RepID=UPI00253FEA15|nr:uncharacterized protein N7506_001694 [Penicillium brevicompactum]KAJ5348441.1 hypothetical protein N7506_001694 [Penicillium brevicompactum]
MSYSYRSERDWDESRPVTIKRYVIPPEDDRRDFMSRHEDPYTGEREMVIRRKTDRDEPVSISRYEREVDYETPARYERYYEEREYLHPYDNRQYSRSMEPIGRVEQFPAAREPSLIQEARHSYTSPRESEYDLVRRSEGDEDPYYYHRHRRTREYDDRRSRRDLSPENSISRRGRNRDEDYSSDDSMVYVRKETHGHEDHAHHRRHMLEGALVGAGAAELMRSRSKKDGETSHGASRIGKTVGAGALGAVAVNAASRAREYYRSKSRHRSHSFDDDRSSHSHRHSRHSLHSHSRHSRSRSRSHSHSRAKTLLELGVGAAAVAAGVAALRSKSNAGDRKSRSRTRSRSRAASRGRSAKGEKDEERTMSERRKHMAGAGLAGAAVAGIVEKVRSHSRARKGERSRSRSRLRQALPIVGAGLATAAATGLYEKKKGEKDENDASSRGRLRSRSRSRAPSQSYPDPARDSAGLIEYGNDPVAGSIPAEHYYGQPGASQPYLEGPEAYGARRQTRSRSRSRGGRYSSSSGSDRERGDRRRKHHSRSRDLAGAALGASGLGYAAHKFNERRKSKSREREREHSHARYDDRDRDRDDHPRDPYEESYDPEPYPPYPSSPQTGPPMPDNHYYPNGHRFPPPPGDSTHNLNATPAPYNPADYPPPPCAAPPSQPYTYGAGPEPYRPRRPEDNVRSPLIHQGLNNKFTPSRSRSNSQPPSKSVAFDLSNPDDGYESDKSTSTIEPKRRDRHRHHSRSRSSSAPHYVHSSRGDGKNSDDSDSTIDLPNRFDSQGRLLDQDPAVQKFEDLVNRFTKVLF